MSESDLVVFVENEAGSDIKHHFDEERFEVLRTERVRAAYPYPYGFVPGTLAPDGDAVDCFVITGRPLRCGDTVRCEPIGLLEQTEGGVTNHNILGVPTGEAVPDLSEVRSKIGDFLERFRAGDPELVSVVGRLLPVEGALAYLEMCSRDPDDLSSA